MKILKLLKSLLTTAAVIYLPMTLCFTGIGYSAGQSTTVFSTMLLIFLFSLLVSLDFLVFNRVKLNIIVKRCLHFVFAYASFYLVFFFIAKKSSDVFTLVVMTLAFILAYAVCGGIKIALSSVMNRKKSDENYKNVYENVGKVKNNG